MPLSWKNLPLLDYLGVINKPLLGIDIGASAVKVLQMHKNSHGYVVDYYSLEPLPPRAVVEKNILDKEAVGQALKKIIDSAKLDTDWAICSVSGASVIMRIIQFSNELSDQEIIEELHEDAEKYIPYPIDEVSLDHEVLGPNSEKPGSTNDVLLAASRTEQVNAHIEVLEMAGLSAKVVDIDAFAFERAFPLIANQLPYAAIGQTVAMVDIGANTMSLNVFRDFKRVYTREQFFGGQKLTEEIAHRYGLTFEQAEQAKVSGNLPDDYFLEVLDPFRTTIIQNIGRFLQFFFSSEHGGEISYLVLTGGGGSLDGLDLIVQERLLYRTFLPDPFKEIEFSVPISEADRKSLAPRFMLCCGLALRENIDGKY